MVHVTLAKDDEVVQAFVLHGLDEPRYEGHVVGRPVRCLLYPQVGVLQRLVEIIGELGVAVDQGKLQRTARSTCANLVT
jgi:hypothetical protein